MSDPDYYDREVVFSLVGDLARILLDGEATREVTAWDDGDFRVVAFHTIDATYPFEAEARDEEDGLPFYRERISFSTVRDGGYVFREVVRRRCGRTGGATVHREPVGWAAAQDPRTADASEILFENGSRILFDDADGPTELRGLDLQSVSLVPEEEAFEGNHVAGVHPGGVEHSGTLTFDVDDVDEETRDELRRRFE